MIAQALRRIGWREVCWFAAGFALIVLMRRDLLGYEQQLAPVVVPAVLKQCITVRDFAVTVDGFRLAHRYRVVDANDADKHERVLQSPGLWVSVPVEIDRPQRPGIVGARLRTRDGLLYAANGDRRPELRESISVAGCSIRDSRCAVRISSNCRRRSCPAHTCNCSPARIRRNSMRSSTSTSASARRRLRAPSTNWTCGRERAGDDDVVAPAALVSARRGAVRRVGAPCAISRRLAQLRAQPGAGADRRAARAAGRLRRCALAPVEPDRARCAEAGRNAHAARRAFRDDPRSGHRSEGPVAVPGASSMRAGANGTTAGY